MLSSLLILSWRIMTVVFLLSCHTLVDSARLPECVTEENVCSGSGPVSRPLPGCKEYATCSSTGNEILNINTCLSGSIFDVLLQYCNHDYISMCRVRSCDPTSSPSESPSTPLPSTSPTRKPTPKPTRMPSKMPTHRPTSSPSPSPTRNPTNAPSHDFFQSLELEPVRGGLENTVFRDSTLYTFEGFMKSLREMAVGIPFYNEVFSFYIAGGDDVVYGRTNVAAFLANAMVESISFNTCDEINTDTGGIFSQGRKYALSNSCGQYGRSYQNEVCPDMNEMHMSCDVDVAMDISGSNFGSRSGPPPLTCGPSSRYGDFAGYWDSQSGKTVEATFSNAVGRLDVEGCCWWGRGVLGTRGVCNIGKLNYYLGKRAMDERGVARFPDVDFCANPGATCESNTEEIRWITGMFEWVERIQSHGGSGTTTSSHRSNKWNYLSELKRFVDRGMQDNSFIDAVSSIITRGCPSSGCSNLEIPMIQQRRDNFFQILDILRITDAPTLGPSRAPISVPKPTQTLWRTPAPNALQLAPPTPETPTSTTGTTLNNFDSSPPVQMNPLAPTDMQHLKTSKPTRSRNPKELILVESNSAPRIGSALSGETWSTSYFSACASTLLMLFFYC